MTYREFIETYYNEINELMEKEGFTLYRGVTDKNVLRYVNLIRALNNEGYETIDIRICDKFDKDSKKTSFAVNFMLNGIKYVNEKFFRLFNEINNLANKETHSFKDDDTYSCGCSKVNYYKGMCYGLDNWTVCDIKTGLKAKGGEK